MDLSNINWKVVGYVTLGVVILLLVVAVIVGIKEAIAAAGLLGTGIGAGIAAKRRQKAISQAKAAESTIEDVLVEMDGTDERLHSREEEVREVIDNLDDEAKVRLGKELLGDD